MRGRLAIAIGISALLAGCGDKHQPPAQTGTATVSFAGIGQPEAGGATGQNAQTVSVSVPGFSAKLNMPGLTLGGSDMSLDGMALHPGTRVTGMQVSGAAGDGSGGEGHGTVELRFADPAAPDQVLAYYRQAAQGAGWTAVPPAAGQQFAATKAKAEGAEHLALQVGAGAGGSTGKFLISGS